MRSRWNVSWANAIGMSVPTVIAPFGNGIRLSIILGFPDDNGVVVAASNQSGLVLVLGECRSKDQAVVSLEGRNALVMLVEFLDHVSHARSLLPMVSPAHAQTCHQRT
jgi:hypothetical protein